MPIKEYKHKINVKVPMNIFHGLHESLESINELISYKRIELKRCKDDLSKRCIIQSMRPLNKRRKEILDKIDAIYIYLRVKAFDYNRNLYPDKEFTRILADNFDQSIKHMRTFKKILLKAGYAKLSKDGVLFILSGNEHVWVDAGVQVQEHKFDEEGKRIAIKENGVYTSILYDQKIVKQGELLKNGKKASKDIYIQCEKKIKVPIIKMFLSEGQLRDPKEFRKALALAMIKRLEDHENSKSEPKQRKDDVDGSIELSSKWFSKQLGYSCTASGWHLRNELSDCGFINITEVKEVVKESVTYVDAKKEFLLQKGPDETGWSKFFSKGNVFAVQCFRVKCNGYDPIIFPRKKQRKKSKFRNYIISNGKRVYTEIRESIIEKRDWIVNELKSLEGMTFRQIYLESFHIIESLYMTGAFLSDNYSARPSEKLMFSEIADLVVADGIQIK